MKPLVIYHGNCADGFGAAWVFYHAFGDTMEYFEGHYNRPTPDVTDRVVYILDFSYKREVMAGLIFAAESVTWIDHHVSALLDLQGLPGLTRYTDMERSGAMLAWDFLVEHSVLEGPPPRLLEHIQDRDLWLFKLEHTRNISAALFSYEYDFNLWSILMLQSKEDLKVMAAEGVAIERKQEKDMRTIIDICQREAEIGGYKVPIASMPFIMASDAGGFMAKNKPFAGTYFDTANERKFSLRSDGRVDVSKIAFAYGGGGHTKAAGFSVPRTHPLAQF